MIEDILYYTIIATFTSFAWLILTGYRPQGESRSAGIFHLAIVLVATALIFFIWQHNLGLTALFSFGYASLCVLLWNRKPDWNSRGHAFLTAFGIVQVVFLGRILWAILFGDLAPLVILGSLVLFTAEVIAVLLTLYFAFEVLDVISRIRWQRYFPPHTDPNEYWPKVSIHVPAHAEPPDMVIKTLAALRNLDYPTYEVIMVDDNTADDELWRPVVDFCHRHGIKVFHLQNYPGFKSGALNFALAQTAPDVEVIAVVDSDYVVKPNFLRETVPYFSDPRVAFVQTPQAFSNRDDNLFAHHSALAQRFFFEVSMRSRNEQNAIIFCGTMGLIRKRVLDRIGGWDEWCITEDAEASLRMLRKGYLSVYINQVYGHGLLPTTFEATKKQRFRWAFGGMQILKRYGGQLLPWSRFERGEKLFFQQRVRYLMGLLGWLNDLLVLVFTGFLLLTTAGYIYDWQLPIRQLAEWLLFVPVVAVLAGVLRVAWALRLTTGCSWRSGLGAFMAMLALSWTVAQACLSALWNDKGTFLRTPKYGLESDLSRALKATSWETALGILLVAAIPLTLNARTDREGILLAILLAWHALIYLSALRFALIEALPVKQTERESQEPAII
ncbi:MAG TPA: glycosyltransferase [Anaerolineales bacterium]|nr:glycosyltransferase [Anaerolineales bacterium]